MLIGFVGGYCAHLIKSSTQLNQLVQNQAEQDEACLTQRNALEQEVQRCIAEEAVVTRRSQAGYTYNQVGILSPLLVSETVVDVVEFAYKRQTVFSHTMKTHSGTIEVWQWDHPADILTFPIDDNRQVSDYFPIFMEDNPDAIKPHFVSQLAQDWSKDDSFTNENDITFYFHYERGPQSIHSVDLQTYWPFSPMGNPIFVSISVPMSDPFVSEDDNDILSAKNRAIEIAKDISFLSR